MNYYLDSSALVKRYFREQGTAWVGALTNAVQNKIFLSEITLAEVAATFAARSRAPGGISQGYRHLLLGRFLQDCNTLFSLLEVKRPLIEHAIELSQNYRLRGYDSVQLATALAAKQSLMAITNPGLIFVASDRDLLHAAVAEGLAIEYPHRY